MADSKTVRNLPWKAHRLRGPVTLEEISHVTKISKRFLEAIESGEYRQLPGGVFTTSYIRQYAEQIDFDCGEILVHQGGGSIAQEESQPADPFKWGKGFIQSVLEKG